MIVIETASFDIQEIKNTTVEGTDYQQGDLLGFWNVLLNVHHLKTVDRRRCALHDYVLQDLLRPVTQGRSVEDQAHRSFRAEAAMGIMHIGPLRSRAQGIPLLLRTPAAI